MISYCRVEDEGNKLSDRRQIYTTAASNTSTVLGRYGGGGFLINLHRRAGHNFSGPLTTKNSPIFSLKSHVQHDIHDSDVGLRSS